MIEARILCDSIAPNQIRLTTFYVKYPRFVHSEFLRHRMLSFSVASSRAMPIEKVLKNVEENPVIPIHWGKIQKGMQAEHELDEIGKMTAKVKWLEARDNAVKTAKSLMDMGLHKQIVNRILEPFLYCEHIVTGTDWGNFFNLRVDKPAEPHIRELAKQMLQAYEANTPQFLIPGEWHLPFCDKDIPEEFNLEQRQKISVARCAFVSYSNFDGNNKWDKQFELHDRLNRDKHFSVFEHQATPTNGVNYIGNFRGWIQYRKYLPDENRLKYDAKQLLDALGD